MTLLEDLKALVAQYDVPAEPETPAETPVADVPVETTEVSEPATAQEETVTPSEATE